jgi:glycosyltransferase involved in cell wall biosynthesis
VLAAAKILHEEHGSVKRVLMIAFHYPPCVGSSGVLRTLKFSRYLPEQGWQPIVLTAHPRAYPQIGSEQLAEIPQDGVIHRAFALDTARHLSWRGAYARCMAMPDRWGSWWLGAVPAGIRLLRRYRPDVIWSTYPIATAHLIGLTLHRLSGIPWVADFRDSMTEAAYPPDAAIRRLYQRIERQVARHSACLIFTAESTRRMYVERYPTLRPEQCLVIPNGYDEENFADLVSAPPAARFQNRPLRLLHAGLMYPEERDPRPFFRALARLQHDGHLTANTVQIDLRASGSEDYYAAIIQDLGIGNLVHLLPALPYRQSLQDCADADALLLFQAASCNHQIPAKAYEYLRLHKPILALTDAVGDTAALLRDNGGTTLVALHDEHALYGTIPRFLQAVRERTHLLPDPLKIQRYSRQGQARTLAACFSHLLPLSGAS